MKRALLSLILFLPLLTLTLAGCAGTNKVVNPSPAALAPGYLSSADQTLGESLAAVNAFVAQEKINYAAETADLQAAEKPNLNKLISATNLANAAYTAFHQGTQTLAQAQAALSTAQNAQTALTTAQGVK